MRCDGCSNGILVNTPPDQDGFTLCEQCKETKDSISKELTQKLKDEFGEQYTSYCVCHICGSTSITYDAQYKVTKEFDFTAVCRKCNYKWAVGPVTFSKISHIATAVMKKHGVDPRGYKEDKDV
jgi:hypothetical protein